MRTVTRTIALGVLTASLLVAATVPALAARHLFYSGETSQGTRVSLQVLRKADGRRFLTEFRLTARITCEDASTERVGFWLGERERLDEDGQVTIELREDGLFGYSFTATATVRRDFAEGTVELITTGLTSDDQAQLCETGVLDWSAQRVRRSGAFAHQGNGLVRLR
jgi:hypothetical protein